MSALRIAVLISGRGSNLAAIFERCSNAEVVGVFADREADGLALAEKRSVPVEVVRFRKKARGAWNVKLADAVGAKRPELIVLAGFMRILSPAFLARFPERVINVHPSLLPKFPGAHAPRDAIAAGVRESGCTIHLVDEGVDSGAILAQQRVPVLATDDADALHERIKAEEHALLPETIDRIARGELRLGWNGGVP